MSTSSRSVFTKVAATALMLLGCASCAPTDLTRTTVDAVGPLSETVDPTFVDLALNGTKDGKVGAVALEPPTDAGQSCSADGAWCVAPYRDDDSNPIVPVVSAAGHPSDVLPFVGDSLGNETYAAWPGLIVLGDGAFLAGVQTLVTTAYSGGGGSATELRLFRVRGDGSSTEAPILTLPIQGYKMIRACFTEAEYAMAQGACHDEYGFSARIIVSPGHNGMPTFTYVTEAWTFPSGTSREGLAEIRRLRRANLERVPDAACSFTRRFTFDLATARYEPDAPLPDCSEYTEV